MRQQKVWIGRRQPAPTTLVALVVGLHLDVELGSRGGLWGEGKGQMKSSRVAALILALCIAGALPPETKAQSGDTSADTQTQAELIRRLQDLEKEVGTLRAQVAEMKQQPATTSMTITTPVASSAVAPAPSSAAAGSPSPSPLALVLGSTSLSGFVDTYYGYNFNQPKSQTSTLRAFDGPSNQFALNLIEINLDKPPDPTNSRLGFHLGLGFGQAMNVVNASDPAGLGFAQYLKEAYISYLAPVGKGLQVDIGKFVTPHGDEVIETQDNWNYSRGLLFTYAIPFYHYGARAKYSFSDKYTLTGFLVNGWNDISDNNTGKTVGATFAWSPTKKVSLAQGYMAGPEAVGTNAHWRQLSDTVLTFSPTSKLSTTMNFDYGRGDRIADVTRPVFWTGIAGYVRYAFDAKNAAAVRYEYFDDHYGFTTGTAQHVQEITGTLQRIVAHHLITRLEYRHDVSNRPVFTKGTEPVLGQNTLTAGMVYTFDTRETK
ncbi:MAG: porin [Terriglobales bacterium]